MIAHTCNPGDRREGQTDADCLRCQQIIYNRQIVEERAPVLHSEDFYCAAGPLMVARPKLVTTRDNANVTCKRCLAGLAKRDARIEDPRAPGASVEDILASWRALPDPRPYRTSRAGTVPSRSRNTPKAGR